MSPSPLLFWESLCTSRFRSIPIQRATLWLWDDYRSWIFITYLRSRLLRLTHNRNIARIFTPVAFWPSNWSSSVFQNVDYWGFEFLVTYKHWWSFKRELSCINNFDSPPQPSSSDMPPTSESAGLQLTISVALQNWQTSGLVCRGETGWTWIPASFCVAQTPSTLS